MFGQTFALPDLATIALLVVLEGLLSIDNALVLGLLAGRLAPTLRVKALSYGLFGACFLRLGAIAALAILFRWTVLKLIGGLYLMAIAVRYFHGGAKRSTAAPPRSDRHSLWRTIATIELMDLVFAIDSILAAVAMVGPAPAGGVHSKLWVVFTGGMLGVVLMRFAAAGFSALIERFPRLHGSAYLMVLLIGAKLFIDWAGNSSQHPRRIDFQNPRGAALWLFWAAVLFCLVSGFFRPRCRIAA